MTRINALICPASLSDQHLLAEHREITRIPSLLKKRLLTTSVDQILSEIPEQFTFGQGHMKFFYDKQWYLFARYCQLWAECKSRGFKVKPKFNSWCKNNNLVSEVINELTPFWNTFPLSEEEKCKVMTIVSCRIKERLLNPPKENFYTIRGKVIKKEEIDHLFTSAGVIIDTSEGKEKFNSF